MLSDKLNSPIFITGCQRSGSTIIAKIIKHCGTFTGSTTEMMENIYINNCIEDYYKLHGWDDQYKLPNTKLSSCVLYSNIKRGLKYDGYLEDKPWVYKSSKICQTWWLWNKYKNAKWIIVRRRTGDIIQSCLKTGYMNAYQDYDGWLGWVHEHEKLFVEMIEAGVNCKQIWPERMAVGDYTQMKETVEWLGLTWNKDIINIVEPLLWNSNQHQKERSKI